MTTLAVQFDGVYTRQQKPESVTSTDFSFIPSDKIKTKGAAWATIKPQISLSCPETITITINRIINDLVGSSSIDRLITQYQIKIDDYARVVHFIEKNPQLLRTVESGLIKADSHFRGHIDYTELAVVDDPENLDPLPEMHLTFGLKLPVRESIELMDNFREKNASFLDGEDKLKVFVA